MLTLNNYDDFLLNSGIKSTPIPSKLYSSIPIQPNVFLTTPFLAMNMSTTSLMHNVKLDVKQYFIFIEENTNWPKLKRVVLSIASTHGLDEVFDKNMVVPFIGDPNYSTYLEKNKSVAHYVQSCLIYLKGL